MKAKCPVCKNVVRINEHRVFLQHTNTKMDINKGKLETVLCKGSYKKAFVVEV